MKMDFWEKTNYTDGVPETYTKQLPEKKICDFWVYMPFKLMLYNEINLSVRFQDSSSHVWEHSRFIIGTVIKQTLLHKEALLGKNKIMYSALF